MLITFARSIPYIISTGAPHAVKEGEMPSQRWVEREVVNALHEGRLPKVISKLERTLDLHLI